MHKHVILNPDQEIRMWKVKLKDQNTDPSVLIAEFLNLFEELELKIIKNDQIETIRMV